jgi:hypothetical protein
MCIILFPTATARIYFLFTAHNQPQNNKWWGETNNNKKIFSSAV